DVVALAEHVDVVALADAEGSGIDCHVAVFRLSPERPGTSAAIVPRPALPCPLRTRARRPQPDTATMQHANRFCTACGSAAAARACRNERCRHVIQPQAKTKNGNQVPKNQNGANRPCSRPKPIPATRALAGMLQRSGMSQSVPPNSRDSTTGAITTAPKKSRQPDPGSTLSSSSGATPKSASTPKGQEQARQRPAHRDRTGKQRALDRARGRRGPQHNATTEPGLRH